MRKRYLTTVAMALALGVTARSSKISGTTAPTTTQAQTTEAATASAEAEDDLEEDYFYGFVDEVNDKVITVAEDEDKAVKLDVTDAEVTGTNAIGVGDEIEVTFNGEMSQDVTKVRSVEIITSTAEEAEAEATAENDETIGGTIEETDDKTATLKTEDGIYTFNTLIAQKVTKGGIKAGVNAGVTFCGDLEDEEDKPVATKIVTEDAKDTPDAKVNALTGKVAEAKSDHVVLDTVDPENTLFTFLGIEGMFGGVKVGDTATVTHGGTLTDKAIRATGVK